MAEPAVAVAAPPASARRAATAARTLLGLLAVSGAVTGVWAAFAPRAFYDDFPSLGRVWVSIDGPYNEHLVRDVGVLNLALAAVTLYAAVVLGRRLVVAAAVGWLVFAAPHLVYHVRHRDVFAGLDEVLAPAALVVQVALAVALLVAARRLGPARHGSGATGPGVR